MTTIEASLLGRTYFCLAALLNWERCLLSPENHSRLVLLLFAVGLLIGPNFKRLFFFFFVFLRELELRGLRQRASVTPRLAFLESDTGVAVDEITETISYVLDQGLSPEQI